MVLFKDDEIEIKEKEKKEKSRLRKWTGRIIVTAFVFSIMLFISLTILSNLGGQSATLRNGFQDYMTKATGYKTVIQQFNYMGFFPETRLDFENIVMRNETDNITVGDVKLSMGFWDITFRKIEFRELMIRNVHIPSGVVAPRAVKIKKAGFVIKTASGTVEDAPVTESETISQQVPAETNENETAPQAQPTVISKRAEVPEDATASLVLDGTYGPYPVQIEMGAQITRLSRGRVEYELPDEEDFSIRFGEFNANGTYTRKFGSFTFEFDKAGIGDNLIAGKIKPYMDDERYGIEGLLKSGDTHVEFDVEQNEVELAGDIEFKVLDFKDLDKPLEIFEELATYIEDPATPEEEGDVQDETISLPSENVNLQVSIQELRKGGEDVGSLELPIIVKGGALSVDPVKGKIAGGNIQGKIGLKPEANPDKDASDRVWVMSSEGSWKQWNYAALQGFVNDKALADMSWSFSGEGTTWSAIKSSLSGQTTIIAGEGKLPSRALNIWGSGLFNALIPSLDPESESVLNCVIADFKIEKGVAKPSPLFLDTKRVTVVGDGEYNIANDNLSMTFEPKSKNTALFDVAPAVKVDGSLNNPQVGVSKTSIIKKVGGLALGVVNPALLVVTMTDLGLGDDHPCREFLTDEAAEKDGEAYEGNEAPAEETKTPAPENRLPENE